MSHESIEQLQPPSRVKFRWFRTVETDASVITLSFSDQTRQCHRVELTWHKLKMLYESDRTFVQCGRHAGELLVDDKTWPLQEFSVVPATFEVNLFLQQESAEVGGSPPKMSGSMKYRIGSYSPLSVDTSWPNLGFDKIANGSTEFVGGRLSGDSNLSRQSYNIYEEMLSSKDREIQLLRQELKELKLVLLNLEADVNTSNTKNYIKSSETQHISAELCDLQREKKSLELETEELIHRVEDTEEARESLEWEVEQLREQLSGNDPAEVAQLLEEMRSLRRELRSASKKNVELGQEVLALREANSKLAAATTDAGAGTNETVYFSDPDSEGTRYRELPAKMELSFSLPALGSPKHVATPRRRAVSLVKELPPLESPSIGPSDDDQSSLSEELPNRSTSPPVAVSVSGTQTDITAVLGEPRRYRSPPSPSGGQTGISRSRKKKNGLRKSATSSRRLDSHFPDENESSDTEELLQEADDFIRKSLTADCSFLATSSNTFRDSRESAGTTFYSSFTKNASSKSVRGIESSIVATNKSALKRSRPFLPKCASEVSVGDLIRYHGNSGRIVQGTVRQVDTDPHKCGYIISSEGSELKSLASNRIFVPFKKVILAMEV